MTGENEEDYRTDNICRFYEKEIISDKVRYNCHLTGKYRAPAHSKCIINVKQKQSSSTSFIFHNFSNYSCPLFFKKLDDKENNRINLVLYLRQMKNKYQYHVEV